MITAEMSRPPVDERKWQGEIGDSVNQVTVPNQYFDVVPPASAPIPKSPELQLIGAVMPDQTVQGDIQSIHRDSESLLQSWIGKVFGWSDWLRHAPSRVYKQIAIEHSKKIEANEDPKRAEETEA